MSAPRSKANRMIKKFGDMAAQYQDKLERQAGIIDRLTKAHIVQGDALYAIEHEAKDVREARKLAKEAGENTKALLAVPNQTEPSDG